jgi:asparagine synthase (glutamine-hydrolysing)
MASIFGCFHVEPQWGDEMLSTMFAALARRGGDSKVIHAESPVFMGVRGEEYYVKKALVMNPARTVAAVVEGEIYNQRELEKLCGDSSHPQHAFDLIIPLYEKFGKAFPRYLNGIFAIALWDATQQRLHLIRDHLGSHSVFYATNHDRLFFGSTIQSLLQTDCLEPEISLSALNSYFSSTAICPPNTAFKNIFCVRPGSIVTYSNGQVSDEDYWPIKDIQEDNSRGMGDFAEEVCELLLDAINIRANYGGTYGSLVSGGIDTSIIAATLATLEPRASGKLPAFSIAFEEEFYNDASLQNLMYGRYDLEPHVTTLRAHEFAESLQQAVTHLDSPVNDIALVGMYKAFETAKQAGCSVVFDGEAADEIFFTGHAHAEREFQKYVLIPFWLRKFLFGNMVKTIPLGDSLWKKGARLCYRLGLPDNERRLIGLPSFYRHARPILLDQEAAQLHDPLSMGKAYLEETSLKDPLNIYYYGLLKTFLPDDLLFKNERMAAAHGITNRTPFIDYRLVELGYRIPQAFKIQAPTATHDGTKLVYKQAIQGLIPDEILHRKKARGFSQPSSVWYRQELKDFVHDTLFSQNAFCLEYVNKKYMHQLFSEHVSGKANFDYLLSSLLIFEIWLKTFLR